MTLCPKCHIDKDRCECAPNGIFFDVDLHIYPYKIHFSFSQNDSDFIDSLRDCRIRKKDILAHEYKLDGADAITIHYEDYHKCVIRCKRIPKTPNSKGDLSHEIDHAVKKILNKLGLYRTNASEEAFTYLTGYITTQAYTKLRH